jgi:hypothetical protein
MLWRDEQVVDPAVSEGDEARKTITFEPAPNLTGRADRILEIGQILIGRMKPYKPRQAIIKRGAVDAGYVWRVRGR